VLCASIGSIQVNEAIKLIAGIGDPLVGRLMVYDALEMTYRTVKVRKDPECPVCGKNPEITLETGLIDYEAFCGTISQEAAEAAKGSTISVKDLKSMVDAGKDMYLVDVREPNEFEIVSIPGATLIPKDRILSGEALSGLPQDKPVVLYCKTGAAVGRDPRRAQGSRVLRRGARRRRRHRVGQPDRPQPPDVLMAEKVDVDADDDIDVRDRPAAHRFEVWVGDRAGRVHPLRRPGQRRGRLRPHRDQAGVRAPRAGRAADRRGAGRRPRAWLGGAAGVPVRAGLPAVSTPSWSTWSPPTSASSSTSDAAHRRARHPPVPRRPARPSWTDRSVSWASWGWLCRHLTTCTAR
jgi:hypothetical protein